MSYISYGICLSMSGLLSTISKSILVAANGIISLFLWLSSFSLWRRKWQPTPVFLPRESQGRGSLLGCCLWGCTESDTTEAT